jgi:hypothetical protein
VSTTAPELLCKSPLERRYYGMDFSNLMSDDETITEILSITSEKRGGGESDLLIDSTGIGDDNKSVEMYIASGTDFLTYRVEVYAKTSENQYLQGDGQLRVTDK